MARSPSERQPALTPPLAAVASVLQPYDVQLTDNGGTCRILVRRGTADFESAMAATGLSENTMVVMLGMRRAHIDAGHKPLPHHIAPPAREAGTESTWDRFALNLWALRMGLFRDLKTGWVPLIGYAGLALLMGVRGQTVRRWSSANPDFPAAACEVDTEAFLTHPLFPAAEARRFGLGQRRIDPRTDVDDIPRLIIAEALRRTD